MTSPLAEPFDRLLADRLARQRLIVTLGCLGAASLDLTLRVAIDPGSRLVEMLWRHVLASAFVWSAVGCVIAVIWRALERGRHALQCIRLEAADAVESGRREFVGTLASLEQRLDAFTPLLRVLEQERDAGSRDRARVVDAVRVLGPAAQGAVEQVGSVADRVEALHAGIEALRATAKALEERDGDLVHRVESAARGLVAIDHACRAMSDRMAPIAGATRDSTASLRELVEATRAVGDGVDSIREVSNDLVARAELGRTRFAETVAGIDAIRRATEAAESIIRALDARTREIGGILDVIDDVGDQTSLLALNAAIIAAQAGEHGRSFSVVAEEIRDLADRVLVGTKEIAGLIRSVQAESERAIGAIEAGTRSVESGVALAAEVGDTFEEITRSSRSAGARIEAVASSIDTQSRVLDRVVDVSDRLSETVRGIESADVERARNQALASESMLGLRDAAAGLRGLVQDQTSGLARVDDELARALESARGLIARLEDQLQGGRGVLDAIEAGNARPSPNGPIDAELVAAVEAVRIQLHALRSRSARTDSNPARPNEPIRAKGESS